MNIELKNKVLASLVAAALTFGGAKASAALIEVHQTIWGMDCVPCAYSMEKALQKLPGVQHVTVSLNQGNAVLKLAADNQVTLAKIQQTVRDSGFTPKSATVKVSGTLKRDDGEWRLEVGKASYTLKPSKEAKAIWQRLQKMTEGATVTITGCSATAHPGQIMVSDAKGIAR